MNIKYNYKFILKCFVLKNPFDMLALFLILQVLYVYLPITSNIMETKHDKLCSDLFQLEKVVQLAS